MKINSLSFRISLLSLAAIIALACVSANAQTNKENTAQKSNESNTKSAATRSPIPAAKQQAADQLAEKDANADQATKATPEKDSPELIRKREEWFYKQRASVNGHIPAGAHLRALQHMQGMMMAEGKPVPRPNGSFAEVIPNAAPVTNTWASIGPTPTTGGIYSPVTGRITTIAIDPSDATGSTVLIGGAQGGIWRTTDGGNTWSAVGDQNASLAMGSIAFSPSSPTTVYAGTGEQAALGFDIYYGAGVLKSTDGGKTWAPTCSPGPSCPFAGPSSDFTSGFFALGGTRISYVAVNPANAQMVLVGAQTQFAQGATEGVYCSDNGGMTWSLVSTASGNMATFVGFASSSVAFAALANPLASNNGKNGIYKSTNANGTCSTITFSQLSGGGLPAETAMGRIDLGVSPNFATDNTVYASIADVSTGSNTNLGVWVTTNGGTSWTQTTAPDICQLQCWYDNVVKVDPNGGAHAFFGGSSVTSGGAPAWVIRTADTGATWQSIIPNLAAGSAGLPHVDNHAMAFIKLASGVRMYLGNDGGIWRTDNAEAASVTWTNLNDSTLTLTQFYPALSINASSQQIAYAGAQDNGSQIYAGPSTTWTDNGICGDGTGTAIDNIIPSTVIVACNGLNLGLSVQNGEPNTFVFGGNGINPLDNSDFVPPFVPDPSQANTFYVGSSKVYQSLDGSNTYTALSGDLANVANGDDLTALAVAPNSRVVYAGDTSGNVFVATNVAAGSGTFNPVAGQTSLPPRTVRAIAVDPSDLTGNTAYAAFSGFSFVQGTTNDPKGHLFKTTDGGATWTDVSCTAANCSTPAATDLPNTPINDVVIDPDLAGTIYVGTDVGVFLGACTTTCSWSTLSTGLPRVAVLSLKLHEPSRTLRAATHGRGVFDLVLNNFIFPTGPHISSLTPTSANSGGAQTTLTVNGSGLTGGTIQFGGTALTATGTSSDTQLSGMLPTSLLVTGTPSVNVKVGAQTSNALTFTVLGGAPTITTSAPGNANVNATSATLTITGTGFNNKSQVVLNPDFGGTSIQTSFTSATQLSATVPASFMANFGSTNSVGVRNPAPGGGMTVSTSATLPTFVVVAPAPANDNFASAITVTSTNFTDTKDSSGATTQVGDPAPPCALGGGLSNTIWYKVTPTGTGTANIDTIGSSYDSVLSVWTGTSLGSLTFVACNDDIVSGVVVQSQLTNLTLNAGTTYFIMVSSFGAGQFNPLAFGGKSILNFSFTGTIGSGGTGSFTVSGPAGGVAVTAGSNNAATVTVTPSGGFTGMVAVTCGTTVPGVSCSPNPLNINVTGASAVAGQLTVNVTGPSSSMTAMAMPSSRNLWAAATPKSTNSARAGWWTLSGGTGLAAMLLLFLPKRKRYHFALVLGLVCLTSFALGCGGYGGGGGGGGGPVPSTTHMTVSSTKVPSTGASATITVSATVAVSTGYNSSTPTGTVQFFDGATALGNPVTLTNGSTGQIMVTPASAPPFFQLVGTHSVTARYSGDAKTNASQSGALNITITGTTQLPITGASGGTNANANVSLTIN